MISSEARDLTIHLGVFQDAFRSVAECISGGHYRPLRRGEGRGPANAVVKRRGLA
jgi:hypothetical protein